VVSSTPSPTPWVNKYTVLYTRIQCVSEGVGGQRRGGGHRQIKHLPQSPFTGKFFYIRILGIAFYQSNLSTVRIHFHLCVIEVRKLLEKGFSCLVCLYRKEGREGLKHRPGLILGIFLSPKSREKKDIEKRSKRIVDIC
jgi:hypothetical protein